jgi:5'-3' exonuclease
MGVRGLMSYCKRIQRPIGLAAETQGKSIGIDAFSVIFLFREQRAEFKAYLESLLAAKHRITFVMDKRAQKEKKEVVDQRKEIRNDAKQEATGLTSFTQTDEYEGLDEQQRRVLERHIALKERDAWCLYSEYVKWLKGMIGELGITLVIAEEEADTVLARGSHDAIVSSDSDLLILGCEALWIPKFGKDRVVQHDEIRKEDFLELLGLEGEQLYELAFLAGCDIQPRKIVEIQVAISLLRFYGSIEKICQRVGSVTVADFEEYKRLRKSAWAL